MAVPTEPPAALHTIVGFSPPTEQVNRQGYHPPGVTENKMLTWILGHCFILSSWGIVFVTTTASKQALLIREIAGPEKIP